MGRRVVAALALALVAATAAFGAVLGFVLPERTGLEEVVVLETAFAVSPASFALYGAVTVAAFLATLVLVVRAISRFDEHALE